MTNDMIIPKCQTEHKKSVKTTIDKKTYDIIDRHLGEKGETWAALLRDYCDMLAFVLSTDDPKTLIKPKKGG